eukprot:1178244-Prorocentrum_minimum.AAC.1
MTRIRCPPGNKFPLRVYSLLPVTIGSRSGYNNMFSFYGSSCAENGKGALNTPETLLRSA